MTLSSSPSLESVAVPEPRQLTINAEKASISYDPNLSKVAGCLEIENGTPPLVPPHGDTLLHLLFFLIYTAEGRKLLLDNSLANGPSDWGAPAEPALVRARLKAGLQQRFPALPEDRLNVVIDAHFAADRYISAIEANDAAARQQHEGIYEQKLLAILGALHDDAMGHEFSMIW